jgi:hypothetical protein
MTDHISPQRNISLPIQVGNIPKYLMCPVCDNIIPLEKVPEGIIARCLKDFIQFEIVKSDDEYELIWSV